MKNLPTTGIGKLKRQYISSSIEQSGYCQRYAPTSAIMAEEISLFWSYPSQNAAFLSELHQLGRQIPSYYKYFFNREKLQPQKGSTIALLGQDNIQQENTVSPYICHFWSWNLPAMNKILNAASVKRALRKQPSVYFCGNFNRSRKQNSTLGERERQTDRQTGRDR